MIDFIEVRNKNRLIEAIICDAISIIWETEYQGAGAFEITVPYTEERFNQLQPDNYITRTDSTELGFIEKVTMKYSPDEGRIITVSGRFGLVLLDRRLWSLYISSSHNCRLRIFNDGSNTEIDCRTAVNRTLIEPLASDSFRTTGISWLSLGTLHGFTEVATRHESTYQNVLKFNKMLLSSATNNGTVSQLGHRMVFDRVSKTMTYDIYKGQERDLIFSQNFNNLLSFSYGYDKTLYKSKFLIAGEGEGAARIFTYRTRKNEIAESTREFCFESEKSKTYIDGSGNQQTYSTADYLAVLSADCKEHFADNAVVKKIEGTVDLSQLEFGTDYGLGDIVTIQDVVSGSARIWSVTEVQDKNGYNITANFEGEDS